MPDESLDVHLVPHTHWDREWYHPAGRFRQRLVALVDELLDRAPLPGAAFLLDGQAIVIEDYLAVRPERAAEVAERLRAGSLEAGPWYVLADELIPGAEALVRNLLAGRRALRALRASSPPVLYCPDSFGHPAGLPALAAGFGCAVIVLWRGYGGARWPAGDTARWRAPSGDVAVLYHLAPDGYELGSSLPLQRDAMRERWTRLRRELAPRSRLGLALLQNGADHHALQRDWEIAVDLLADTAAPDRLLPSSLARFGAEVERRASETPLPVVEGELRDSYGYTWTLQGTFATRAAQKRRNALAERLLVREAEPWAALAAGVERHGAATRSALLRAAWRTLLRAHPHDTLCGTSTDDVARAMDGRLDEALAQGAGVRDDALLAVAGHDAAEARERGREAWTSAVLVRNSAARPRAGVCEIVARTFVRDVPVGPGSAPTIGEELPSPRRRAPTPTLDRGAVPTQGLTRGLAHDRVESPRHYPDNDLVEERRLLAWVAEVPGYGTRGHRLTSGRTRAALPPERVTVHATTLDNGRLRIELGAHGEVGLRAPSLGVHVADALRFESTGDRGDSYTTSLVGETVRASFLGARLVQRGPLRGELETRWRLLLPIRRFGGAVPWPDRRGARRAAPRVAVNVTARLIVDAGAPFLRVAISGTNRARDHRLRVVLATGVHGADVWADAAFGPVHRAAIVVPEHDRRRETPPPTAPLHRYVSLYAANAGATIFSDGLAEYEATAGGDVAITLLRAIGELSRNDLPERPGHAGWPVPTPESQSLGPFEASIAIMPHGARTAGTIDAVERVADDVLLPLTGTTLRSALAVPGETHGASLEGSGLAFGALKPSDDGEWTVARCVNLLDEQVQGRWTFGFAVRQARLARLDETPLGELSVEGETVSFDAAPRAVVTILVR